MRRFDEFLFSSVIVIVVVVSLIVRTVIILGFIKPVRSAHWCRRWMVRGCDFRDCRCVLGVWACSWGAALLDKRCLRIRVSRVVVLLVEGCRRVGVILSGLRVDGRVFIGVLCRLLCYLSVCSICSWCKRGREGVYRFLTVELGGFLERFRRERRWIVIRLFKWSSLLSFVLRGLGVFYSGWVVLGLFSLLELSICGRNGGWIVFSMFRRRERLLLWKIAGVVLRFLCRFWCLRSSTVLAVIDS